MKELRKKLWAKLLAAALLFLFLAAALGSTVLALVLAEYGIYDNDGSTAGTYCTDYVNDRADIITGRILSIESKDIGVYFRDELAGEFDWQEPSNFAFTVTTVGGNTVYTYGNTEDLLGETSREAERYRYGDVRTHTARYSDEEQVLRQVALLEESGHNIINYYWDSYSKLATINYQPRIIVEVLHVSGGVDASFPVHDNFYYVYRVLELFSPMRYWLLAIAAVGFLLSVLLTVFLCSGAGRRAGDDEVHEGLIDRIPLGGCFLLAVLLGLIPLWLVNLGTDHFTCHTAIAVAEFAVALILTDLLLLGLLLTICSRLKRPYWWKNTLCYRVFRPALKALWRGLVALWRYLPLYWKSGIVWIFLCLLEGIALFGRAPLLWVIEKVILTPLFIACIIFLRKLQRGAEKIGGGDLEYQIDVTHMPHLLREHGLQLNHIGDGLQNAVQDRMRSERMKAELITNVSHDIKTPLTSVINYVDLLKKEGLQSEKAPEYLEVLDRQTARLKKLTEDLIEASKASTGNVSVLLEATDLNVMLSQALGEYEGRLEKAKLETVVKLTDAPATVQADGKLLWRVFDNLLGNVCKYAMPSTRVYVRTGCVGGLVFAEFKNISAQELDIAPEELMERFVRGDASRNTEGSGLGLSIAGSLMELQGGELQLSVDGDLFKATVLLKAIQ